MRNKEGGQEFGNQQEVRPLIKELFDRFVKTKLAKPLSFERYRGRHPKDTHISLVRLEGKGPWTPGKPFIGSFQDVIPDVSDADINRWTKGVTSWESPEAQEFGKRDDSEPLPRPSAGGRLGSTLAERPRRS
jgi:hypothetical protein